ncbi:hypothetical protein GCM10010440_29880 [Kitasatospora cinereorecta]
MSSPSVTVADPVTTGTASAFQSAGTGYFGAGSFPGDWFFPLTGFPGETPGVFGGVHTFPCGRAAAHASVEGAATNPSTSPDIATRADHLPPPRPFPRSREDKAPPPVTRAEPRPARKTRPAHTPVAIMATLRGVSSRTPPLTIPHPSFHRVVIAP